MTEPAVSIVFSTRNHGRQLRESLPSILAQSETAWELLIADDGSEDDSCAYIESLADPRIRLIRNAYSAGDAIILNRVYYDLVAMAKAPFVCPTISTAVWHPDKLRIQLDHFAKNPDLILSSTRAWLIDELDGSREGHLLGSIPELGPKPILALCQCNPVVGPAVMVRRSDFLQCGGYDPSFLQASDYHLWLKLAMLGPFNMSPLPLLGYRLHPHSQSQKPATHRVWMTFIPAALQDCLEKLPEGPICYRPGEIAASVDSYDPPGASPAIFKELAITQWRHALDDNPADPAPRNELIRLLSGLHRYEEARQLLPANQTSAPDLVASGAAWQTTLHQELVEAHQQWRQPFYRPWAPQGEWQAIVQCQQAWQEWQEGRPAAAGDHWLHAFAIRSHDPYVLLNLGHYYVATNQPQPARRLWQLAASLRPDDPGLRSLLGQSFTIRIYAAAASEATARLSASGCDVTIGGPFRRDQADVVLLHDEFSLALLECDPAPVFIWADARTDHGIPGLDPGHPLAQQLIDHLTGPRRRFMPWGDPPAPARQALPTSKARHWLFWLTPGSDLATLASVLAAYRQGFTETDDCCLIIACDRDHIDVGAVTGLMREAINAWGGDRPAVSLLARPGLRLMARPLLATVSALILGDGEPGLRSLAATVAVPIVPVESLALAEALRQVP